MRRMGIISSLVVIVALVSSGCIFVQGDRSNPPPAPPAAPKPPPAPAPIPPPTPGAETAVPPQDSEAIAVPLTLPRMIGPITFDGDLKEWKNAAHIIAREAADIDARESGHEWRGPEDAGVEAWVAWNDQGLCVAMMGYDSEIATSPDKQPWQQDCLKIYLDLRAPDSLMKAPRSEGFTGFYMNYPDDDGAIHDLTIVSMDGEFPGLKIVGKRVKGGATAEMLIPWSSFPAFAAKPGVQFGLQIGLNDLDKADGDVPHPLVVVHGGISTVAADPDSMIRCELGNGR